MFTRQITGRRLVATISVAAALALPATALAGWFQFYDGDLNPSTNAQTSSHQLRYDKLMGWVVESRCAKMWYRNNGSAVDYYVVQECDGFISDGRQSTDSAWAYCRNVSSYTINADCYTCINDECYA